MNRTAIEWTTFSANPLKFRDSEGRVVWGCVHESEGCRNCYSEAIAKRYRRGGPFTAQTMAGLVPFLDDDELRQMRTAKVVDRKAVAGECCFVGDMTDLFGEWVPDDLLNRLFSEVLERRQEVTWQLLTKRADRLQRYLSWRYGEGRIPARNVHVGVSVEDQAAADERIPLLLQTPAAVRFVSYEPALGPVDLRAWLPLCADCNRHRGKPTAPLTHRHPPALDQIIVGGESGSGARPFDIAWARSTVKQGRAAGVPVFVKQLGARPYVREDEYLARHGGPAAEGDRIAAGFRYYTSDLKGGDMAEWPQDIRVREFPEVKA